MIGVFIVLNIVWLATWIYSAVKYYDYKHTYDSIKAARYEDHSMGVMMLDFLMCILWGLIILVALGTLIGNLL